MCHHPTSTIIRTRVLKSGCQSKGTGYGKLRIIEYIRKLSDHIYQGTYRDGRHWRITSDQIRRYPERYRLRKEPGHRDCYQLVITQDERYRELVSSQRLLGPMQCSRPGVAKYQYNFSDDSSATDKSLIEDKGWENFELIWADLGNGSNVNNGSKERRSLRSTKQFLRETKNPEKLTKEVTTGGVDTNHS